MRWLFTADLQADWSNLDACQQAIGEALQLMIVHQLEGIVILGDLKREYNPVDVRVTEFWVNAIAQIRRRGYRVVVLMGNHDRIGLYQDARSWLPILEHAGAEIVVRPYVITTKSEGGGRIFALPYRSDTSELQADLQHFNELKPNPDIDVLAFHADLRGARLNASGAITDSQFVISTASRYRICIGGHIHEHQQVGEHVYYVGSPFACDWGEANQSKGYMIVTDEEVIFAPSSAPEWYDPALPNYTPPATWEGQRVRIRVSVSRANYHEELQRAREEAAREYPGAAVHLVPEFREQALVEDKGIRLDDSDANKIAAYLRRSTPAELKVDEPTLLAYLLYKLQQASGPGLRASGGAQFIRAHGEHFLSYDSVDVNFNAGGVVVVTGQNNDWHGRSNGAGKTSFLSLIPVALFGKTFKGQDFDKWSQRHAKDTAKVTLEFEDGQERLIQIERTRNPATLRLWIDGKEESSGIQQRGQTGVQGMIERLSGLTWQTLANAIYIDQQEISQFLFGTSRQRKEILERFLNLERFAAAQELVKQDVKANNLAFTALTVAIDSAATEISSIEDALNRVSTTASELLQATEAKVRSAAAKFEDVQHTLEELEVSSNIEQLDADLTAQRDQLNTLQAELATPAAEAKHIYGDLQRLKMLPEQLRCPTCYQKVSRELVAPKIKELEQQLLAAQTRQKAILTKIGDVSGSCQKLVAARTVALEHINAAAAKLAEVQRGYELLQREMELHSAAASREQSDREHFERKLRDVQLRHTTFAAAIQNSAADAVFLNFALEALSRKGIPAFLTAKLIPPLNEAAEVYSRLFADSEIQVHFECIDGEIEVLVVNPHGGGAVADQSVGELRMAALITSFALREISPKCNALLLDEPVHGLCPSNARALAIGINALKDHFETIFVISHSTSFLAELAAEHSIMVIKEHGVSSVTGN